MSSCPLGSRPITSSCYFSPGRDGGDCPPELGTGSAQQTRTTSGTGTGWSAGSQGATQYCLWYYTNLRPTASGEGNRRKINVMANGYRKAISLGAVSDKLFVKSNTQRKYHSPDCWGGDGSAGTSPAQTINGCRHRCLLN